MSNYLGDSDIVVSAEELRAEIKLLKIELRKAQLETAHERVKAAKESSRFHQEKKELRLKNLRLQQDVLSLRLQVEDQKNKPEDTRILQLSNEIRQLELQILDTLGVGSSGVNSSPTLNAATTSTPNNNHISSHAALASHALAVVAAQSGNSGDDSMILGLQFTCQQTGMLSAYDYYEEYHHGKNGNKSLVQQYNDARRALKELRHRSDDKRSTGKYTMKSIKNNTTYSRRSTFVNKMDKFLEEQKELGNDISPKMLANRIDRYADHHKRTVADLVRNPGWDEQVVFNYLD